MVGINQVAKIVHYGLLTGNHAARLGAYAQCSRFGVSGRFRAVLATAGRN
jgi:hypothetical protein